MHQIIAIPVEESEDKLQSGISEAVYKQWINKLLFFTYAYDRDTPSVLAALNHHTIVPKQL